MATNRVILENTITNRIQQIKDVVELDAQQLRKLEVAGKRLLIDEDGEDRSLSYFGNPLASDDWKNHISRTLSREQLEQLNAFDEGLRRKFETANSLNEDNDLESGAVQVEDAISRSTNIALQLQLYLYLSEEQTQLIEQMAIEYVSDSPAPGNAQSFSERNRENLTALLTESQSSLLSYLNETDGLPPNSLWSDEWQLVRCADCHTPVGD
ncbi:MAG: hypothetical protein AAF456_18335 [Planctomycetota bacterium]